eukprot:scaffold7974_cov112-Isochrysis_galbana.AAC.3
MPLGPGTALGRRRLSSSRCRHGLVVSRPDRKIDGLALQALVQNVGHNLATGGGDSILYPRASGDRSRDACWDVVPTQAPFRELDIEAAAFAREPALLVVGLARRVGCGRGQCCGRGSNTVLRSSCSNSPGARTRTGTACGRIRLASRSAFRLADAARGECTSGDQRRRGLASHSIASRMAFFCSSGTSSAPLPVRRCLVSASRLGAPVAAAADPGLSTTPPSLSSAPSAPLPGSASSPYSFRLNWTQMPNDTGPKSAAGACSPRSPSPTIAPAE